MIYNASRVIWIVYLVQYSLFIVFDKVYETGSQLNWISNHLLINAVFELKFRYCNCIKDICLRWKYKNVKTTPEWIKITQSLKSLGDYHFHWQPCWQRWGRSLFRPSHSRLHPYVLIWMIYHLGCRPLTGIIYIWRSDQWLEWSTMISVPKLGSTLSLC